MSTVKDLFINYEDFQIDIPYWEISDQGITALWGPSGSGKTTVLRALIGLEPCQTLQWHFQGQDLARLPIAERRLGVVFQSLELFPHMTALQNIHFAAQARKISREEARQRINHLSEVLQMDLFLDRRVGHLSGGERQRVALARSLVGKPRCLLLDEPFSALDVSLRDQARALVGEVIAEFAVPAILVTHDTGDIRALAPQVRAMQAGRFVDL